VAAGLVCFALITKIGPISNESKSIPVTQNTVKTEIKAQNQTQEKPAENLREENMVGGSDYDLSRAGYYYKEGYEAYKARNYKKAANNLSMVVDMNKGDYINREALYYLARTYYLQGNDVEAEKYYLKYLKEFPDSNYYDDSLYYLGAVYHARGDHDKALKAMQEMQKVSPNSGYESSQLFKEIMKTD
jgi:TolA-binding protein